MRQQDILYVSVAILQCQCTIFKSRFKQIQTDSNMQQKYDVNAHIGMHAKLSALTHPCKFWSKSEEL